MSQEFRDYARQYHAQMPYRIRLLLGERGISDSVIDRFYIGWSGWRITVPIYDRTGDVCFFTLLKDPADPGDSPLVLSAPNAGAELYGWEHIREPVEGLIVCDGVLERLLLESRGYAAVASTESGTFRREWAKALTAIPRVHLCLPMTAESRALAVRIGRTLPRARLVSLPPSAGEGGVGDFFLRFGGTCAAFDALLAEARPLSKKLRGRGPGRGNRIVARNG